MEEKIRDLIDYVLGKGADYVDIRYKDIESQNIETEDEKLKELQRDNSKGVGIRVIKNGSPGFAATGDLDRLQQTGVRALELAGASSILRRDEIELAARESVEDYFETPYEKDPFSVSTEEKIELLLQAEAEMNKAADLHKSSASMRFQRIHKIYADSEGSYIEQELVESGGGIEANAVGEDDLQVRTYPCSFGGNHAKAGYEFIEDMELVENAARTAEEAVKLTEAEECPQGEFDIVIDSTQMALQIHESIGHPIELDRVFGSEEAYAGTSFLKPEYLDEFQYGSEKVNVVADATVENGLGSFGYDDEGVPAQKVPIIEEGIFAGFLTSRADAARLAQTSGGTCRADGWENLPLIRMTNINLLPGDYEFEELISDIDYGLYLEANRSWSIDDRRLNFQFSCEIAYEIKDGALTGKIFKNPIYTGHTPEFWRSCAGICNEDYWQLVGVPNCGKGQPGQTARVGHGSSPAKFRSVKVGVKNDE